MLALAARHFFTRSFVARSPLSTVTTIGNLVTSTEASGMSASAQKAVDDAIALPVAVFSKSYCPYVLQNAI